MKYLFPAAAVVFLVAFYILQPPRLPRGILKESVLTQCVRDQEALTHYHATLVINYMGKRMTLPDNIGIEEDCLHPIQVHDGKSGMVHVHFTRPYPFTVGDFFTVWGVVFNKSQLGGTFASTRRNITMKVNGKPNNQFENYVFKDNDEIEINITPNYSE